MNRRMLLLSALAVLSLAVSTLPAHAQRGARRGAPNYGVGFRPGLSPYLNIIRGGNTGVNYFLGTIPEIERRNNEQALRQGLQSVEQRLGVTEQDDSLLSPLSTTGHPTTFGNLGTFFGPRTEFPGAAQGTYTPPPRR
jgi:hypothetical protein